MTKLQQEIGRGFAVTDTAAVAVSNTTAESTLFTQTISGGRMGNVKRLSFSVVCMLTTPALSLPTITIRVKLGSSTLTVANGLSVSISLTNEPFFVVGEIINKGTGNQIVWARIEQAATSLPLLLGVSSAFKAAKWTEDTTVDKAFSVTCQFSLLSASTILSAEHVGLELS